MATGVDQERFTVEVETVGGAVVLTLAGELDLNTAKPLREALEAAAIPGSVLVVDLTNLGFCDSAGLNVLLQSRLAVNAAGGVLRVSGVRGAVARMFHIAGVDRVFEVHASVAEALGGHGGA